MRFSSRPFFLFTLFPAISIVAQTDKIALQFSPILPVQHYQTTIETVLKLKNNSANTLRGELLLQTNSQQLYLVQQQPKKLFLKANDSLFVGVKAILSKQISTQKPLYISAKWTDLEQNTIQNDTLYITTPTFRLVQMILPENPIYFEHLGDSLSLPVRLINRGNTIQKIELTSRFSGLSLAEKKTFVIMRENADTLFFLKKKIYREDLTQERLTISIKASYENGETLGYNTVYALPIRQNQRFIVGLNPENPFFMNTNNFISVGVQTNSIPKNNQYSFLFAAEAFLKKSKITTFMDWNWWENNQQLIIRTSRLGYQSETFGIQAGTISRFDLLPLNGLGIETSFKPNLSHRFEAGIIQKNNSYLLASSLSNGQSAWINYSFKEGWEKGAQVNFLRDVDYPSQVQRELLTTQFSVFQNTNYSLQLGSTISHWNTIATTQNNWGNATEIQFKGKYNRFSYQSSNFLSTRNFVGNVRGAIQMNESVYYQYLKTTYWVQMNHLSLQPKPMDIHSTLQSESSRTQWQFGLSRRASQLFYSLSLVGLSENRKEFGLVNSPTPFQSKGIQFQGNYKSNTLSLETGYYTNSIHLDPQFHFKSSISYQSKGFQLLAFYQYNSFEFGDLYRVQNQNTTRFTNLILSSNLQTSFFNNQLHYKGGIMYTKNSSLPPIIQTHSRLDWDWNKNFSLYFGFYYTQYSKQSSPLSSFQFGINQRFNPLRFDENKIQLEVYLYYDISGNGASDSKNLPAQNQLILINGHAFRTNAKGLIQYRNLPKGVYEIQLIHHQNWYAPSQKITLEKNTKLAIGLTQTATIKGSLSYKSNPNSFPIEQKIGGIGLNLKNKNGNLFSTKTDDFGNYVFYIPQNNYVLTLETNALSEYVKVISNSVEIEANPEKTNTFNFRLQIQDRKIEVQKFESKKW